LLDGITMGGGMGLAQGSRMRIVGDRTRMAMPEVGIGFFPDVGASFFLSRLTAPLGLYLALTGAPIRAADALYVGLADAYLSPESVQRLDAELAALKWSGDKREDWSKDLGAMIARLASPDSQPAALAAVRPAIDEHFAHPTVAGILHSLQGERRPQYLDWAQKTLALINTRSPTMLAVAVEQMKRGRSMSVANCLRMELGMVKQCFAQGDFMEGVRALIIDKDNTPVWRPSSITEVTEASVEAIFQDPWAGSSHPLSHLPD